MKGNSMIRKLFVLSFLAMSAMFTQAQSMRHFTFRYAFAVNNLPAGQRVRVWFPMAHSDAFQEVRIVSAKGDRPLKKTREGRFGNEFFYAEVSKATAPELHFEVVYDVVRHEHVTLGAAIPHL